MLRRELLKLAVAVGAVGNDNDVLQMQLVFKEEPKVPNIRLLEKFGKSRWSDSMRVGLDIRAFEQVTPRSVTAYDGDKYVGCAVFIEKPGAIEIVHINGVDEDVVAEIARHVVNGDLERTIIVNSVECDHPGENGKTAQWHEDAFRFEDRIECKALKLLGITSGVGRLEMKSNTHPVTGKEMARDVWVMWRKRYVPVEHAVVDGAN